MAVVQLEHGVRDFSMWKAAFDRDPLDRKGSGVRSHRIYRPVDDPNFVAVDLEFGTREEAESFKRALEGLWRSPLAAPALAGVPKVRIVETVEAVSS
jgi:hypothetical protein